MPQRRPLLSLHKGIQLDRRCSTCKYIPVKVQLSTKKANCIAQYGALSSCSDNLAGPRRHSRHCPLPHLHWTLEALVCGPHSGPPRSATAAAASHRPSHCCTLTHADPPSRSCPTPVQSNLQSWPSQLNSSITPCC